MNSINITANVDLLTTALQGAKIDTAGVTFAGKSLKLDTENDAKEIIDEINKCQYLEYLNLEGNTVGVEASKAIAVALEKHSEFKRALWKDMFTGRLKTEIPQSLEYFGASLVKGGCRLTVLDLSDNAFGPIGVQGLAALIESSSCYALEELRLNNNGLGINGGKLLASALTNCYNNSAKEGKPLALKVFIAGRNRLENEGAKALASVFKLLGSLDEIAMPQNGIYFEGIQALSNSFKYNKNIKILNLNDNTLGKLGRIAIIEVLPELVNLKAINFGDCLLKTKGAIALAKALKSNHRNLEDLNLSANEIKKQGGIEIVRAMENKSNLKNLILCDNEFGKKDVEELRNELNKIGKLDVHYEFSNNDRSDEEEILDSESEEASSNDDSENEDNKVIKQKIVSIEDFLEKPNQDTITCLISNNSEQIIHRIMQEKSISIDNYVCAIMKIASFGDTNDPDIKMISLKIVEKLFEDLFAWGQKNNYLPLINNSILVNLQLIKSEDKILKPTWNIDGCYQSLKYLLKLDIIPVTTKQTLEVFIRNKIGQRDVFIGNEILQLLK